MHTVYRSANATANPPKMKPDSYGVAYATVRVCGAAASDGDGAEPEDETRAVAGGALVIATAVTVEVEAAVNLAVLARTADLSLAIWGLDARRPTLAAASIMRRLGKSCHHLASHHCGDTGSLQHDAATTVFGQGYGLLYEILTRYGPERSRENERIARAI